MLLAASAQDGTPLLLINLPTQTLQRPALRRRNQHFFIDQRPPTPATSEPNTAPSTPPGPLTHPDDDKPSYFSCLSCLAQADREVSSSRKKCHHCNVPVVPNFENAWKAWEGPGGMFSDNARPDRDACFEDHLGLTAGIIRLIMRLPSKASASPANEVEFQCPDNTEAPQTQRRYYSFSSSDSEISSVRHVEDVENPVGGVAVEPVMGNLTAGDSGVDISGPVVDSVESKTLDGIGNGQVSIVASA